MSPVNGKAAVSPPSITVLWGFFVSAMLTVKINGFTWLNVLSVAKKMLIVGHHQAAIGIAKASSFVFPDLFVRLQGGRQGSGSESRYKYGATLVGLLLRHPLLLFIFPRPGVFVC
ncbi:MAG TPA: hypothetical protein ENJ84_09075 [Gammaproteobacteria bacterium]|nr:hypothetical protein [Gammaproteobacteria bacterium]